MPDNVTYPYSVTIKKDENLEGTLYIPWSGEEINEGCWAEYETTPDPEEIVDEATLTLGLEQYNALQDINLQIQGTTIHDFKLRVVYPQAPFDALGLLSGNEAFVYPNDEIEINPRMFYFQTLGFARERVFIKGLNEYSTAANLPFMYRKHPNSQGSSTSSWESGKPLGVLYPNPMSLDTFVGGQVQITTPKGSFTVTFVD